MKYLYLDVSNIAVCLNIGVYTSVLSKAQPFHGVFHNGSPHLMCRLASFALPDLVCPCKEIIGVIRTGRSAIGPQAFFEWFLRIRW